MRTAFFFGAFQLLFITLYSQGVSGKIIKMYPHINNQISGNFYIDTIIDARTYNKNIGIIKRLLDNPVMVPLLLDRDFFSEMGASISKWKPRAEEQVGVTMTIKEIFLWDYFDNKDERRFAKVVADFYNEGQELGTFVGLVLETGAYKRFSHERRLEKAFWECINRFARNQKKGNKTNLEEKGTTNKEQISQKGAFENFLDFKLDRIAPIVPNLIRVDEPSLFRYKATNIPKRGTSYYGFMENGEFFLKATNYASVGDYYVKALEKGPFLFFIDRISSGTLSQDYFEELDEKEITSKMGIVINREDGVPHFVTDEYLKKLTKDYPDLQQKYLIIDILSNPIQLDRVRRLIAEINERISGVRTAGN